MKETQLPYHPTHPLLYKVVDPNFPGIHHYLFGTNAALSPEQIEVMAEDVIRSDAFQHADMLLIEAAHVHSPHSKSTDPHKVKTMQLCDMPSQSAKHDHCTAPAERDSGCSQTTKDSFDREALISTKSLTQSLVKAANHEEKAIFPLETPTAVSIEKMHERWDRYTKPHNIAKIAALLATGPVGVLAAFLYKNHRDNRQKVAMNGYYMEENLHPGMNGLDFYPGYTSHIIEERNDK